MLKTPDRHGFLYPHAFITHQPLNVDAWVAGEIQREVRRNAANNRLNVSATAIDNGHAVDVEFIYTAQHKH